MIDEVGSPRLLWPSNIEEAGVELERVGDGGTWPGPFSALPRSGRPDGSTDSGVALGWSEPVPPVMWGTDLPAPLLRRGRPGRGLVVFGPADGLLTWLERLGTETEQARAAVRFGTGLETPRYWQVGRERISLREGTRLMAVVNVTPDSFYAGSRAQDLEKVGAAVEAATHEGADIIDIGGESTSPGAEPLPAEVEVERVVPAVELAVARTGLPISVDTTKAEVARAALEAGAVVVNDITAGTGDPRMLPLVAESGAGVVLMHRKGVAATMQVDPRYDDLVGEIYAFLASRAAAARAAGIEPARIVADPGLGFGKRRQHNFELYRRVAEFHCLGYPLLVGPSRKLHTSGPSDKPAEERLMATAAACAILAYQGVQILRVHDVGEMRRALDTVDEIRGALVEDRVS